MFNKTPFLRDIPDTACLVSVNSGRQLDLAQLSEVVNRRAGILSQLGLPRGARIVVASADSVDYLTDVFACWVAGYCAVAVNPGLKPDEMKRVAASTRAGAWLSSDDVRVLVVSGGDPVAPRPLDPDDPALMLMTSGTTGTPKGVVHCLRGLSARIRGNRDAMGDRVLRRSLNVLPVFFGHGLIGNCLTPLAAGGRLFLWGSPDMAALAGFGGFLDENRITFFSSVPTFWKMVLRVSPRPATPPERVHVGSAPLSNGLWSEIVDWAGTDQVYNMFGMTETANWIAGGSYADADGQDGFAGHAWGGELAVLVDDAVVGTGTGEVLVRSAAVMQGFWEQPEKSAAAFVRDWFRSGDIGTLVQGGALVLKGRIKSEINRAGIKILAEEIDMLLERHPDIAEACAFGIEDAIAGEVVAAALVMRDGAAFDVPELKAWCNERVRSEAVPARLFEVPEIPRNDRGKIVRSAVRDSVLGSE